MQGIFLRVPSRAPSGTLAISRRLSRCSGTMTSSRVSAATKCPLINRKDHGHRGFTLLELLVVLAILGLLIGLVAPRALSLLGSSKQKIAHIDIERIAGNLDIYKLDVGTYPTSDQGLSALIARPQGTERWNGPYIKGDKLPEDPWGHPFVYRSPSQRPGHDYDLYSLGPTGQAGGSGENAPIYNN